MPSSKNGLRSKLSCKIYGKILKDGNNFVHFLYNRKNRIVLSLCIEILLVSFLRIIDKINNLVPLITKRIKTLVLKVFFV